MTTTYRLSEWIKYFGIVTASLFLAALPVYVSLFFLEDPAKHGFLRKNSELVVGGMGLVVFGTMLLLAIYIVAAYYMERLTISETTISIRSVFQNRQFGITDIERLIWAFHPAGGTIFFHVGGARLRLDLHGYRFADRIKIIGTLRALVRDSVQEGWTNRFEEMLSPASSR